MASSSTSAPFGRVLTATQLRAGLWVNHFAYSSFMAWEETEGQFGGRVNVKGVFRVPRTAKSFMSARKMLTLTTLLMSEPAATRTALRLRMQVAVFSWIVPPSRLPSTSK